MTDGQTIHIYINNPPNIFDPLYRDDIYEMIREFENYTAA
jgi:hypothetical protein